MQLVGQLSNRPDSQYAAILAGGAQFYGWDDNRYLLADIRDILLVIGSGLGGKKVAETVLYPRPEREEVDAPATVADFDIPTFMRRLAS